MVKITDKDQLKLLNSIAGEMSNIPVVRAIALSNKQRYVLLGYETYIFGFIHGKYYFFVESFGGGYGTYFLNMGAWASHCSSSDPIFFPTISELLISLRKVSSATEEDTW